MSSGVTEVDMGSFAVLFSDCDPSQADDKELPTNAYLVEYIQGETSHFDIVMSSKKVDIFDYYYDKYNKDLLISLKLKVGFVLTFMERVKRNGK